MSAYTLGLPLIREEDVLKDSTFSDDGPQNDLPRYLESICMLRSLNVKGKKWVPRQHKGTDLNNCVWSTTYFKHVEISAHEAAKLLTEVAMTTGTEDVFLKMVKQILWSEDKGRLRLTLASKHEDKKWLGKLVKQYKYTKGEME